MSDFSIRAGRGLGDALYLQSVVRHLTEQGERPEVCTSWPDVFLPLAGKIDLAEFRRLGVDRVAHYTQRKHCETDQFQDCCIQAGITDPVDLRIDWSVRNHSLVEIATDKPIVLVQLPRAPFGRLDGYGKELLPDCNVIQKAINHIRDRAFIVQVGSGTPLYRFSGIDLDLRDKTSVSDLLDIASVAHGFLGYCSFFVPLAESFSRPALFVWSQRGLRSPERYVRQITPKKILHRDSSKSIIDNAQDGEIAEAADALLEQIANR